MNRDDAGMQEKRTGAVFPRWLASRWFSGVAMAALALGAAVPLIASRGPTSLLPPGFGDSPAPEQPAADPRPAPPAAPPSGSSPSGSAPSRPANRPPLQLDLPGTGADAAPSNAGEAVENGIGAALAEAAALSPEELAAQQQKYDLPAGGRRSLDNIGPLPAEAGGLGANAFGTASGQYLAALMRESKAPIVSRWASILLRRALLSATDTPRDIAGADWAAERAWLLVRMGEADAARLMVQSVDNDQYSKRLYAVAMQAYLASADPVGLCPHYQGALTTSSAPGWRMAEAICASFSAEQGRASAILNQTERRGGVRGIDYRLTEKMAGAGANARRSVKIEWDGVDALTPWRFGLATALNVDVPQPLLDRAGPRVLAWQARAPALAIEKKQKAVETAARLGVFSSSALLDYYSQLDASDTVPQSFQDRAALLRQAYAGAAVDERIEAMRRLWGNEGRHDIVAMLSIARAAASLPVSTVSGGDISNLIAAMMSAGHDLSALRWAGAESALAGDDGLPGWAMLAVGAPRMVVDVTPSRVQGYIAADAAGGRMLLAGLAGLGRLSADQAGPLAEDAGVTLAPRSRWAQAIDRAARNGEKGTVAVLAAVGMQVADWRNLPPEHLYHIVSALHRVGLNPEARMIAAEAVMRS